MKKLLVAISLLASLAMVSSVYAMSARFSAQLTGDQEVPPVTTSMTATIFVAADPDTTNLRYELHVHHADRVTTAHLHCGPSGQNGPIVTYLFGKSGPTEANGELNVSGNGFTIEPTAKQCATPISNQADLLAAIKAGTIYANVHTQANPMGEIRGQLSMSEAGSPLMPTLSPMPPTQGQDLKTFMETLKRQNDAIREEVKAQSRRIIDQFRFPE